jgi:hypothetical protein
MDSPKYEEVQQWLIKSQRDLKVAWVLFEHKESLLDSVVYHCQQSAEKSLKAYLTYQNITFRKTHDLDVLIDLCSLSEPSFQGLKDGADILQHFDFKPATKEGGRVKPRNGFYFSICSTFDRNSL